MRMHAAHACGCCVRARARGGPRLQPGDGPVATEGHAGRVRTARIQNTSTTQTTQLFTAMTTDDELVGRLRNEVARLATENELLRRRSATSTCSTGGSTSSDAAKFPWTDPSGQSELWHGTETVPLVGVADLPRSVQFYVGALGFSVTNKWIDEGVLRWCQLRHGGAGLMLQQRTAVVERSNLSASGSSKHPHRPNGNISLCIFCEDAIAVWDELRRRGSAYPSHPQVLNGLWVTGVVDPDGLRIDFESECTQDFEEGTYWIDYYREKTSKL